MSTAAWAALALFGVGFLALALLLALGKLEDHHPDYPDDHEWFFGELLEDADVQEMVAKRRGREGR